jgi:hypothetical protein
MALRPFTHFGLEPFSVKTFPICFGFDAEDGRLANPYAFLPISALSRFR